VLAALGQSPTPFCTVVTRKAFGVAGGANHKPGSHHFRYAWPSGDWGSLPIEGGIEVAYKAELELAADDDAHLQKIKARLNIDPRDTRPLLCQWARLAWRALKPGPVSFTYSP
jgi:propionyl-CoA carboxylase beta chain